MAAKYSPSFLALPVEVHLLIVEQLEYATDVDAQG
jgi:hypothetical protein